MSFTSHLLMIRASPIPFRDAEEVLPVLPLLRTRCADDGRQRRDQNVEVEPERTVLDIEAVFGALHVEIAVAARRDLPKTRQPWRHARPQRPEFGIEGIHMVGRKRPR